MTPLTQRENDAIESTIAHQATVTANVDTEKT